MTEDNRSREHIIPKALGGRRTVRNFLCASCNNLTGTQWDAKLIEASKPVDIMISSQDRPESDPATGYDLQKRGNRQETKVGDTTYTNYRGGGFSVVRPDGRDFQFEVAASNESQVLKITEGVLRKRNIPKTNWSVIERQVFYQWRQANPKRRKVPVSIRIATSAVDRSMVKSMLALACLKDVSMGECQLILDGWRIDDDRYAFGTIPEWDVLSTEEMADLRCVAISGSPDTGVLLGFTNLTGFLPWVVPLAIPYCGPPRRGVYAINSTTGLELDVNPQMERPGAEAAARKAAALISGDRECQKMMVPKLRGVYTTGGKQGLDEMVSMLLSTDGPY